MSTKVNKYRVYCETEAKYVEGWFEEEPTVCPNNNTHTITANLTTCVEETTNQEVSIANMSTIQDPLKKVQRVAIQPGRTGYYMNFRDFRLNTATYAAAESFEDVRVDNSTNKRVDWGEMSFVGCYKGDDSVGYTLCTDQADADANSTLSIWDYCANDQKDPPSPLDIDLLGGIFWTNANLPGTGEDLWKHQVYVCIAPNIPRSYGGQMTFFDSYLYPHQGKTFTCSNTISASLNPAVSVEAARVRIWVYYPTGQYTSHVIGFKIYRTEW